MKAYLKNSNIELEVRSFFNKVNEKGIICKMAEVYARAYDSIEEVPLDRIEIR